MKVAVIGSRDPVLGFALAGVKERYQVKNPEEAEDALDVCLLNHDIGIILIDEQYAEHLTTRLTAFRKTRRLYPIILSMPGEVECI